MYVSWNKPYNSNHCWSMAKHELPNAHVMAEKLLTWVKARRVHSETIATNLHALHYRGHSHSSQGWVEIDHGWCTHCMCSSHCFYVNVKLWMLWNDCIVVYWPCGCIYELRDAIALAFIVGINLHGELVTVQLQICNQLWLTSAQCNMIVKVLVLK